METQKATMYSKHCRRCGRLLNDEVSRQRGFGEGCYNKYLKEQTPQLNLFNPKHNPIKEGDK